MAYNGSPHPRFLVIDTDRKEVVKDYGSIEEAEKKLNELTNGVIAIAIKQQMNNQPLAFYK